MKSYFIFTKNRLISAVAVFVCIGLICCELASASNAVANAKTNSDRIIFIKQQGYILINEKPTEKNIIIPETFNDVYSNYNALQKKSGYNLSLYKGCEAMLYTYKIKSPIEYDGECMINIITYNDRVIGGDVSADAFDGFILPIKNSNEKTKT